MNDDFSNVSHPACVNPQHPGFVQRMQVEHDQLEQRITALTYFIAGPAFRPLDKIDQDLLKSQLHVMNGYLALLEMRIERALPKGGDL
jgi:hypothetical protein